MKTFRLLLLSLLLSYGLVSAQEAASDPFGPAKEISDPFQASPSGAVKPPMELIHMGLEHEIRQKLKTLFVPSMELESTPLDIAIEFLMSRSVEVDTYPLDPNKKGVNFLLRPEEDHGVIPEVTVSAANITLEQAITLIAKAVDKEWWVANGTVVIGHSTQKREPFIAQKLSSEIADTLAEWKTIIFPSISFGNTPISEALDLIRERSAELDNMPPFHPIKLNLSRSAKKLTDLNNRIDLGLWNASAFDVLVHALAQGGYSLSVKENEFQVDDQLTDSHFLEWDHWLWMMRIAKRDPKFTPPNFDSNDKSIRMFERKSAKQIYEACGIELGRNDSFIYSVVSHQMITRLGRVNRERIQLIHKTMEDWKAGRTDEWHLDWMP